MPRIYLSAPDISPHDFRRVEEVLASNWVAPVGPHLEEFERCVAKHVGVGHAVALNSGTAALHLALKVLGVGSGDSVVCPSFTFAASANPICYLGAEPIFVDSEPRTWNMDPVLLEQALDAHDNVKAVIVVHLYGQCAEMDPIRESCRKRGIPIVEDAAEAMGASYQGQPAGSLGDLSFFSFNGNKIITTSGGGMLLSDGEDWISRARHLSTQAREPAIHYEHKEIGYNYRMSNVLAGLGLSQFADLEPRIAAKRRHYESYENALAELDGVEMMPLVDRDAANYWLSCIVLSDAFGSDARDQLVQAFQRAAIEARPLWKPMHLQPVFADQKAYLSGVSEKLFNYGLCLPSGSGMSDQERAEVIEIVRDFVEGKMSEC